MGAADGGHEDMVEVMVERGADPSISNHDRATAVDYAERRGHTDVVDLLKKRTAARAQ
jgi:ankyrin repeat protein